ncbi:MAG: CoA-binding protein [Halobacteriovoraceae bacterium]|nr:CoA-binding protein [Halobacteriovoraceae bacterium]MCB9095261.1 CoA-binding protein [Halobacteriovoraceae bacterium]
MKNMNVAVLGASDNPERYSYKAFKRLEDNGYSTFLVSPKYDQIESKKVYHSLSELKDIDTLTVYVNKNLSSQLTNEIVNLAPRRVIFNPGTENPELIKKLEDKGIETLEACTLVLLSTKQFND